MPKATCQTCGTGFSYFSSNSSGKYCSNKCCVTSPEWKKKQSIAKIGKKMPHSMKAQVSKRFKGKKQSVEHITKRTASRMAKLVGVPRKTQILQRIRLSKEYIEWRRAVFERDHYTCQMCRDKRGGNLEADHIISLSFLVEEARITGCENYFDIDNGRTLCTECHKKTDSYAKHRKHHLEGRLLETLYRKWEQLGKKGDFEAYYRIATERFIDQIKASLE